MTMPPERCATSRLWSGAGNRGGRAGENRSAGRRQRVRPQRRSHRVRGGPAPRIPRPRFGQRRQRLLAEHEDKLSVSLDELGSQAPPSGIGGGDTHQARRRRTRRNIADRALEPRRNRVEPVSIASPWLPLVDPLNPARRIGKHRRWSHGCFRQLPRPLRTGRRRSGQYRASCGCFGPPCSLGRVATDIDMMS